MIIESMLVQGITMSVAVLGAVLGIINTWHGLDKARVKLVVRPKHAIPYGAADPRISFCVEVTNLSSFAVTVEEVGVFYKGTNRRGAIADPYIIDGGKWPRRLDPRSSVTVYSRKPESSTNGHVIRCAYVRTECGVTKTGTSPALKQIARESA